MTISRQRPLHKIIIMRSLLFKRLLAGPVARRSISTTSEQLSANLLIQQVEHEAKPFAVKHRPLFLLFLIMLRDILWTVKQHVAHIVWNSIHQDQLHQSSETILQLDTQPSQVAEPTNVRTSRPVAFDRLRWGGPTTAQVWTRHSASRQGNRRSSYQTRWASQ